MIQNKRVFDRKAYLSPYWYAIALSKNVNYDAPHKSRCFGEELVLYRDKFKNGQVIAQTNICPHRGAPLDKGWLNHDQQTNIVCPYHGWEFDVAGNLSNVPSLKSKCYKHSILDTKKNIHEGICTDQSLIQKYQHFRLKL